MHDGHPLLTGPGPDGAGGRVHGLRVAGVTAPATTGRRLHGGEVLGVLTARGAERDVALGIVAGATGRAAVLMEGPTDAVSLAVRLARAARIVRRRPRLRRPSLAERAAAAPTPAHTVLVAILHPDAAATHLPSVEGLAVVAVSSSAQLLGACTAEVVA